MTILTTARCTLRPFTINDVDALYRLHSHPVVMQHIPRGTRTREEILEDIQDDITHQKKYGFSKWAVFSKESGEFIGRAGWAWLKDEVEAGYKFFPEYWGKGYATEILKALLSWGKANISAPLVAFTYPDNIASIRVMEKAGMLFLRNDTYEGKSVVVYGYNKMHDDELDIDESLVTKLLTQQFPGLANLPIKRLTHSGTDHAIFRLGDEYAIRLPRVSSAEEQMVKEQEWLPKLNSLPLTTPNPIANGKPSNDYPYHWYVYRWIEGNNAYDQKPDDLQQTAVDLAAFIKALWKVDTAGAPPTRRGLPLSSQDRDVWVNSSATELRSAMDESKINTIMTLWEKYRNAPRWSNSPVWLHGDLLPSNLLVQDGKLHAVIDFGLAGIGDPACDMIPAWSLFDAASRVAFKEALGIDEDTWDRGKGWALSIAVIIIPYYLHTNPVLLSVAKRMIEEITRDL